MSLINRIRRQVTVATGNFGAMFKDVEIPPLPAAAASLIETISAPDPDLARLVTVISSSPDITARVLQTINSSLFSLRSPVLSVRHAVSLLGLRHIRPIALSHAMQEALPQPDDGLFSREGFWSDCLLRAMLARAFACRHCPGEEDEAFTAMLVSDVALPVLLDTWSDYYRPIAAEWGASTERLSAIERRNFGWDHAQASAWILQRWGLPQELVCYTGLHNSEPGEIRRLGLWESVAVPLALSSQAPSALREDPVRAGRLVRAAQQVLSMGADELLAMVGELGAGFEEVCKLFRLRSGGARQVLQLIGDAARQTGEDEAA